jgi:hypothetical protein
LDIIEETISDIKDVDISVRAAEEAIKENELEAADLVSRLAIWGSDRTAAMEKVLALKSGTQAQIKATSTEIANAERSIREARQLAIEMEAKARHHEEKLRDYEIVSV